MAFSVLATHLTSLACLLRLSPCGLSLTPLIRNGHIQTAQQHSLLEILGVQSYKGYLTVDEQYESNMFFWFFPAENKPDAPLLLWLNGGPGSPSTFGALLENGPLALNEQGMLERRSVSWTESFHMLYIDNPVGVGYSSTNNPNGYSRNMDDTSKNLYSALVQFFQLFPQYAKNEFYAGGQSYACKYVAPLGRYIHDRNNDPQRKVSINFKGVYIGGGYCDPIHQSVDAVYLFEGDIDFYNVLKTTKTSKDLYKMLLNYLQSWTTKMLFGARSVGDERSVRYHLAADFLSDTVSHHNFLIDNYKVLHYTGNLDVIVSVPMTEAFLQRLNWRQDFGYNGIYNGTSSCASDQYCRADRSAWFVNNELAGWYTTTRSPSLTRVIVRNAGHNVPTDQPERALAMMKRFVAGQFEVNTHVELWRPLT
ncbi:venom serine carboxypeptidase-like isoform X3 [Littorina saxatilis]|uniref:venom serine carboxypeptidase-like isoform X3 n=1 Tax=Littorina saxatilis TaxID=31220 RepID=UPI0038B565E9